MQESLCNLLIVDGLAGEYKTGAGWLVQFVGADEGGIAFPKFQGSTANRDEKSREPSVSIRACPAMAYHCIL